MAHGDGKAHFFDQLAVVGKAFASPKRLEMLELLAQGERPVDAIAAQVGLGVSTVSAHLQILKLANLVTSRRDGTRVHYRLAGDDVAELYRSLGEVARRHSPNVDRALAAYLGTGDLGEVEQVSREELLSRLEAGDVLVIDVRPREEYEAGHVPGAVAVPFGELLDRIDELRTSSEELVAYCRGAHCVLAHDAVRLLADRGVRASRLQDGMLEWRLAGLPVVAGR